MELPLQRIFQRAFDAREYNVSILVLMELPLQRVVGTVVSAVMAWFQSLF